MTRDSGWSTHWVLWRPVRREPCIVEHPVRPWVRLRPGSQSCAPCDEETDRLAAWGVVTSRTARQRASQLTLRVVRPLVALVAAAAAMLLGLGGAAMASTSSANADVLGISDSVQSWLCGIVNPSEPWENVGDGPESWMSNRNLVGAEQVVPIQVDSIGQSWTRAPLTAEVVPDTMDQLPALPAGNYTLYEVAGLRGLSWWTIPLNPDMTRNCNLWNYVWSQAANGVFTVSKIGLQITISIKEAAAADDPLKFLYDESSGAVATVFVMFFVPIATLMFILAGIWLGVKALRNKGIRAAVGGVAVAAGIIALAGFAYAAAGGTNGFRWIAGTVDNGISQVNAVATNALFDGLTQNTGACTLPDGPADAIVGQRISSCVLADSLAYRPWAIGQFGGAGAYVVSLPADWTVITPGADGTIPVAALREEKALPCYVTAAGDCTDLRTYLIAQHGGVQVSDQLSGPAGFLKCSAGAVQEFADTPEWMAISSAFEDNGLSTEPLRMAVSTPCSPMLRVFTALSERDVATAKAYAGDVGIARFTQALSALLGTAVTAVPVLVIGIITMTWIALTFALYITGPFKLAFATYTGKAKMAKDWAGDLVHAWLSRMAYGIVLTLTILIIAWMLASTLSFGLRLVWLGVILVFFWKLVQKVQETIRPGAGSLGQNLAGDMQGRVARGARTATRTATRSTFGAGAGVLAARERRRVLAMDPTRGPVRRTAGALLSPATMLAGGLRGAIGGPQDAQRQSLRTMSRAQLINAKAKVTPAKEKAPAAATGTGTGKPTPRDAGSARTVQVAGARDATSHRVNRLTVAPPTKVEPIVQVAGARDATSHRVTQPSPRTDVEIAGAREATSHRVNRTRSSRPPAPEKSPEPILDEEFGDPAYLDVDEREPEPVQT